MRFLPWVLLFVVAASGCGVHYFSRDTCVLNPAQKVATEAAVRRFVASVATEINRDGPAAWHKEFSDSPAFFMASEGLLVFPDSQTARKAIDNLARTVKHIELRWGDDLRIDPLTPNLAVVGMTYHEIRDDTEGHHVDETGYFTGLAESLNGQWQFRDAHWSVVVPPAKVP
jgi:hypothetical protein